MDPTTDTPLESMLRIKLYWTIEEWSRRNNDWHTNRHPLRSLMGMIARGGPVAAVRGCLMSPVAINVNEGALRSGDIDLSVETTMLEERFRSLFLDADREVALWNLAQAERQRADQVTR